MSSSDESVALAIRKRKRSLKNNANLKSKKLCKENDSKSGHLQEHAGKELSVIKGNTKSIYDFTAFQYRLNLLVAFTIRKFVHKSHSLSIEFDNYDIEGFNDIVFRNDENSIHVKIIANINKCYKNNDINITYSKLFNVRFRGCFHITTHFNSFVKYLLTKLDENNLKYLVIYANTSLDLTKKNTIKNQNSIKTFYPFKFDTIENCDILKDLFELGLNSNFYQFSKDEPFKQELYKKLIFSESMKKEIKSLEYSENEIKEMFIDKLVFAVHQPYREELNYLVKKEIEKTPYDYTDLREAILCHITASEKYERYEIEIEMLYNFNLLMLFSHNMFLHESINSIKCEIEKNEFSILHKNRIVYIKIHNNDVYDQFPTNGNVSKLFNYYFEYFTKELKSNARYFITNFDLEKIEGILKLDKIDTSKKRYRILRYFSKIGDFYQFSNETTIELISNSLKIPNCLQKDAEKDGKLSIEFEKDTMDKFIRSLIFVKNQPNRKNLQNIIRDEINSSNVPYNYEDIYEIISRWIESNQTPFTKETIEKLLNDINNQVPSFACDPQNKDEEMRFAKAVVGSNRSESYDIFLDYLIKGEKLSILKNKGIAPSSMSSILYGSGPNSLKNFQNLYDLWFDDEGHSTKYLTNLAKEGIKISSLSHILAGSRGNAAKGFKDLYELLFDEFGNRTKYLEFLYKHQIKVSSMSSILGKSGGCGAKVFKELLDLLIDEPCYLKTLSAENIRISIIVSILNGSGLNAVKCFKNLYHLWFKKDGSKSFYLETLEKQDLKLSCLSSIMKGARSNAPRVFKDLFDLWFDESGNKKKCLKVMEKEEINLTSICSILSGSGPRAAKSFKELYDLWFDKKGQKKKYLKTLELEGINLCNMSSILTGARTHAAKAFKDLYDLWFDENGHKKIYLKTLEKEEIKLSNVSGILDGAGANAAETFKSFYDLWFDSQGNKTHCSKTLAKENIKLSHFSGILHNAGVNAVKAFKELYDLWFDQKGNKTKYLIILEREEINLHVISSILNGSKANASKAFKDLYDLWFDEKGDKLKYLKTLEKEGISLKNLSSILHGSGVNAVKACKDLYNAFFDINGNKKNYLKRFVEEKDNDKGFTLSSLSSILSGAGVEAGAAFNDLCNLLFDENNDQPKYLKTLEKEGINLRNISSILSGAGTNAVKAFKHLYDLLFDQMGTKTSYLRTLEKEEINLSNMFSILSGAGQNAAKAFKGLYDLWFDEKGDKTHYLKTLEKEEIKLNNISSILGGAGSNAAKAFRDLYEAFFDADGNKTPHLMHFIEKHGEDKCFSLHNISSILSGAGSKAKNAFEKLHDVLFNEQGERTDILVDFNKAGFEPSNLSGLLCQAGDRAPLMLRKLYKILFDNQRESTNVWKDFYNAGFSAGALCSILSGAPDDVEKFHHFCFVGETKIYLAHFLEDEKSFRPGDLSKILHGAGSKIYGALKEFHDACYDENGNRREILNNFDKIGFTPNDLSNILSLAGNNATAILRNFHDLCFNKENYLNHFLAEEKLFTSKDLSKILYGAGVSICPMFEKLHNICFDQIGKKTKYLENLVTNEKSDVISKLYENIRTTSFSVEDDL